MPLIDLSVQHGQSLEEAKEPSGDGGPQGPEPIRSARPPGRVV